MTTDDHGKESAKDRLERNWAEILQELRVIQTGTQILMGFLLTIAFQQRFTELDDYQIGVYLALVSVAALATVLAITPVSLHRALFRRQAKELIVRVANRILKATLAAIGVTLVGTVLLVFDVVLGPQAAIFAAITAAAALVLAWFALPSLARSRQR